MDNLNFAKVGRNGGQAPLLSVKHMRVQNGAPGRIRTSDTWLRKPVLYPLSYGRLPFKGYSTTEQEYTIFNPVVYWIRKGYIKIMSCTKLILNEQNTASCKCYNAVLQAYKGLLSAGRPEICAIQAARIVYNYHHPEVPRDEAALVVDHWVHESARVH